MSRAKSQHIATEPTPALKGEAWASGLDAGRSKSGYYGRPRNPYEGHFPGVSDNVRVLLESIWNEAFERGCQQRAAKEAEGEATNQA